MGNTFKDKYFVKKREVLQTNRKSKGGPEKRKFVTGIGTQRRRRVVDTGSAVGLVGLAKRATGTRGCESLLKVTG